VSGKIQHGMGTTPASPPILLLLSSGCPESSAAARDRVRDRERPPVRLAGLGPTMRGEVPLRSPVAFASFYV
jgi:hypothetical protein